MVGGHRNVAQNPATTSILDQANSPSLVAASCPRALPPAPRDPSSVRTNDGWPTVPFHVGATAVKSLIQPGPPERPSDHQTPPMSASVRRTDILSLANLRDDGRRPHDIRKVRIQLGPLPSSADVGGSSLLEMGLTTALATVRGPVECFRRADERHDRAVLQVTVKNAPFATADRRPTASSNPHSDRRLVELSSMVRQTLEAAILLHLFPRAQIEVTVYLLADDGSRLCAAINAASLALMDANIPMKDFVCACSAGYAGSDTQPIDHEADDATATTLVDLNHREESPGGRGGAGAAVQLTAAMLPQRGTIVLTQCEAKVGSYRILERVLDTAMGGCAAMLEVMAAAVKERAATLEARRNRRAVQGLVKVVYE